MWDERKNVGGEIEVTIEYEWDERNLEASHS